MNLADDQSTEPIFLARTILNTTDHLRLPASALLQDARRAAVAGGAAEEAHEVILVQAAEAVAEPPASLDGHAFVTCLERSAFGEIWKARGPRGRARLAFCVNRSVGAEAGPRLQRLQALAHPALPHLDIVCGPAGQVILLTDHPKRTLASWARQCRAGGLPGVPPSELLPCLHKAAEALDELFQRHGLQHLGLQPGSLWLDGGRVRIGGFGLVQMLGLPTRAAGPAVNPRYVAPELHQGRVSTRCDQYSLALIYAEAATGIHPLDGPGGVRPSGRGVGRLELGLLSSAEREALARALHPDPDRRFKCSARLFEALRAALPAEASRPLARPAAPPVLMTCGPVSRGPNSLDQLIRELLTLAAGPGAVRASHHIRYRLEGGQSLQHRCAVNLFPGAAQLKLEGFRREWGADTVTRGDTSFVFSLRTSVSFWERLVGRQVGLEVHVHMPPPTRTTQKLSEVGVVIRPFGCGRARAVRLLEEMGPVLVESLRSHLQAQPEQRAQDRVLWNEPLRVHPVVAGLRVAAGIDCLGKDISARGIGFFLPQPLSATHLYVNHPGRPQVADVAALVKVVRGQPCQDGWYEVGALFAPESPQS